MNISQLQKIQVYMKPQIVQSAVLNHVGQHLKFWFPSCCSEIVLGIIILKSHLQKIQVMKSIV